MSQRTYFQRDLTMVAKCWNTGTLTLRNSRGGHPTVVGAEVSSRACGVGLCGGTSFSPVYECRCQCSSVPVRRRPRRIVLAPSLGAVSRPSGRACSALGAPNLVPRSGSQTHQTHHVRAARTRRNAAPMHRQRRRLEFWRAIFWTQCLGCSKIQNSGSNKSLVRKSVDSDSKER